MGIRVHKMVGYGLTDVKVDGYKLADPRINSRSPLLDEDDEDDDEGYEQRRARRSTDAYFEFVDSREGAMTAKASWFQQEIPQSDPFDCVVHQTEYGLANVLCIRPVGTRGWGWYRSDDTIDYMEESFNHDQQNRVQVFERRGLYPFEGFMNAETGERIGQDIYVWLRAVNDGDERAKGLGTLDMLAQHGGFKDHDEAQRLVVPYVPEEIRALAEFGGLFTGPDVWRQLRPMLYVYWG